MDEFCQSWGGDMKDIFYADTDGNLVITMEWKDVSEPGQITCGGNPLYACGHCGHIYGSHEIYPSAPCCDNCGARAVLSV